MIEVDEDKVCEATMDYEVEYYRFKDRYDALSCKCELMHGDYETLRRENEILKAQMDVVHLIFGSR